jgi:uncharacterized membrane protein
MRIRRPRLAAGVLSGVLTYIVLLIGSSVSGRLRFIISWDVGIFIAMVALYIGLRNATTEWMKRIAAHQDAGKWVVLILALVAAGASLIAIAQQIPLIKNSTDFYERASHVCFIIATIVLSWSFVNTIFALHYAHDYYSDVGNMGLLFPGNEKPVYMDFVYFSFVIGMTFQVSDVQVTDPVMRRVVILHGLMSFFYATGILALTINMVAGVI